MRFKITYKELYGPYELLYEFIKLHMRFKITYKELYKPYELLYEFK